MRRSRVRDALELGRDAYTSMAWREAFTHLAAADAEAALDPDDLEGLATAAYLMGRDADARAAWARAYHDHVDRDEVQRAARCGYWLSVTLLLAGEGSQSGGWLARTQRLLDARALDCPERGYLLVIRAYATLLSGDAEAACSMSAEATSIGVGFGDTELTAMGLLGQGEALCETGQIAAGIPFLDEAMVAVASGEVSPITAGILYCASILSAQQAFDLRRVSEWTIALDRWSRSQPDLVPFRGQCLVHRSEIKALHGAWPEAFAEARRACAWLSDPAKPTAGLAFYQYGELLRLQGDLGAAEDAYREASRYGHDPQPGYALLRLVQGRTDDALATIRRVLDEAASQSSTRYLSAAVEIRLAAGDPEGAAEAANMLAAAAAKVDKPVLWAMSEQGLGAVAVGVGAAREGLEHLRKAQRFWSELHAPYEVARVRVLVARALELLGDGDGAALELDAARATFRRLGATPDLAHLGGKTLTTDGGVLTAREREILALVAAGGSNREIAADLVISERTVARHLANIFAKLDVASRAAATAYGLKHRLI